MEGIGKEQMEEKSSIPFSVLHNLGGHFSDFFLNFGEPLKMRNLISDHDYFDKECSKFWRPKKKSRK